ncbi:MAG: hypothetical protein KGL48_09810 [Sphingomonadales bacterium]|nr:hypothetical protein [Sphingomonadales bacterium]MDE2570090.1 hypothetical protein [Sphingomonadales bacterium]
MDPSEAADSGRILAGIAVHFPHAEVVPTGGVVYQLALNDVLANFHDDADYALLDSLLFLDEQVAKSGLTQYAAAWARKVR